MADEFTPTTEDVLGVWIDRQTGGDHGPLDGGAQARADFYRWLAAHDREVAARAWDEGERHEAHTLTTLGQFCPNGTRCNPYREGEADR